MTINGRRKVGRPRLRLLEDMEKFYKIKIDNVQTETDEQCKLWATRSRWFAINTQPPLCNSQLHLLEIQPVFINEYMGTDSLLYKGFLLFWGNYWEISLSGDRNLTALLSAYLSSELVIPSKGTFILEKETNSELQYLV